MSCRLGLLHSYGSARQTPRVNLTTVAAFTAAGLAFVGVVVNVFWGYRLSSRAQLEQWRRNEERPIVARILTLSEDARKQWDQTGTTRRDWIDSLSADPDRGDAETKAREASNQWDAGVELYGKLRFEAAQLDLTAGAALRDVAARLVREHESLWHWLRPASPMNDWSLLAEENNKIVWSHAELIRTARADLGVDRRSAQYRLRSRWRRFRGLENPSP
jgi:hypothetical protein